MITVRLVIAIAASKNWIVHQMDAFNAFLKGDLIEEVHMELPRGFAQQDKHQVCRLVKSLYGLK